MNEIHCKNCGAHYAESVAACPYCGAENEVLARKKHEGQLERLRQRVLAIYERIAHEEAAAWAAWEAAARRAACGSRI